MSTQKAYESPIEGTDKDAYILSTENFQESSSMPTFSGRFAWLQKFNYVVDSYGGESRGIERVPEDERHDESYWNSLSMWLGSNMVIAAFSLGMLGAGIWDMAFWDATLTIIFFTIMGGCLVALFSLFGPESGLRSMTMTRYFFGYQTTRICCLVNAATGVGWTAVNTIASANVINVVNNGGCPIWAACFVVIMASLLATLFGYRILHFYEQIAWIPNFIVFIIIAARMGMSKEFSFGTMATGRTEAASVLSFGAATFGFAAGWVPYAVDYTAYKPKHTNKLKLFLWICVGEQLPIMFTMILGAACVTPIKTNPAWADAYNESEVGGILWKILVEDSLHGFGQFCIVILGLSTIANNIPNIYTSSLSMQTMFGFLRYIPRYVWSIIIAGVSIAVAIPGASNFSSSLSIFMGYIGYWVALYSGVGLSEHFIYRKGSFANYDLDAFDDWRKMPMGIGGLGGGILGIIGAWLGMAQTDYVGPIGLAIEPIYGGDIGWILALSFGFIGHAATRWIEIKWDGGKSFPKGDKELYYDAEQSI